MSEPGTSDILVLGLGYILLSDDGVGVRAIQHLQDNPRLPEGITLIDGSSPGAQILSQATGVARLLVLDAIDVGLPPGTLVQFNGDAISDLRGESDEQPLGIVNLLEALQMLGWQPQAVRFLGVQPSTLALGTTLSPVVTDALESLVDQAISTLAEWSNSADSGRKSPCSPTNSG